MRPSRPGRIGCLTLVLAATLLLPQAGAEPMLASGAQLQADVQATPSATTVPFHLPFSIPAARSVYLKVAPKPGNPVFGNGTVGGAGWWTGIELSGPHGTVYTGATSGDPPQQFGRLASNTTYSLDLTVHAPAGAFAGSHRFTLDYILAESAESANSGSGGSLDESLGLHLAIRVQTAADAAGSPGPDAGASTATGLAAGGQAGASDTGNGFATFLAALAQNQFASGLGLGLVFALAAVLLVVVARRRSPRAPAVPPAARAPPPPPPPSSPAPVLARAPVGGPPAARPQAPGEPIAMRKLWPPEPGQSPPPGRR